MELQKLTVCDENGVKSKVTHITNNYLEVGNAVAEGRTAQSDFWKELANLYRKQYEQQHAKLLRLQAALG